MVLRAHHFDLRSLFTHHFLHQNWIHLTLNVVAVLYAGRVLEVRWGSLRFSGFYLAAAVAGGLTAYLVGLCNIYGQRPDAPPPPEAVSLGASSAALACLTAYTLSVDDRPCLGCLSERYLIWAGMIVGAAGLVFLQEVTGANVLLTPQLAGIATGAALHCALPWWAPSPWTAAGQRNVPKDRDSEIRTRVDQLLEKISRDGIQSLSYEERTFLRDASKHFRNR
jgi:membrane associated rhomboid family serine protease